MVFLEVDVSVESVAGYGTTVGVGGGDGCEASGGVGRAETYILRLRKLDGEAPLILDQPYTNSTP